MNAKALLLIFLIVCAGFAFSASNGYWLRGKDFTSFVEGGQINFATSNPPNVSSTKTVFTPDSRGVLGTWFTSSFQSGVQVHTKAGIWANGLEIKSGALAWSLFDFDSLSQKSTLIASGELRKGESESLVEIGKHYIEPRHRLKLVLEAGDAELTIDGTSLFSKSEWVSPDGEAFSAPGIESTALLFINQCSSEDIACSSDADCDDSDPFTSETCSRSGECGAYCSYDECIPGCINSLSCLDDRPLTIDVCANAGNCGAQCESRICIPECVNSLDCDDSDPATKDRCVYGGTCFAECRNTPFSGTITYSGCSMTECSGSACFTETIAECCGNGVCEQGETCAEDCEGNPVEIISPKKGDYANRGEDVGLIVRAPRGSSVEAEGFFGTIILYDDGRHNDSGAGDGIYAAAFNANGKDGSQAITVKASGGHEKRVNFSVVPLLETFVETSQSDYVVSDLLEVNGNIAKKSAPLEGLKVVVSASSQGIEIFEKETVTDGFGNFSADYRSLSLDPNGPWEISVSAEDGLGNSASAVKTVHFRDPEEMLPLRIELLNPESLKATYYKGENFDLDFMLTKGGEPVEGAVVKAIIGREYILTETGSGIYALDSAVPQGVPSGEVKAAITAEKEGLLGKKTLVFNVESEGISISLLQPKKKKFGVGETVLFQFLPSYPGAEGAGRQENAILKVNGGEVELQRSSGVYSGYYYVENEGDISAEILVFDGYGEEAEFFFSGVAEGYSIDYYVHTYLYYIAGLLVLLALVFGRFFYCYRREKKTEALETRRKNATEKLKYLQTRYFKLGSLSRKKYDELMLKYEQELQSLNAELDKIRKKCE